MNKIILRASLVAATVGLFAFSTSEAEASGALLTCEPTGNGAFCEASPTGEDYGYTWSRSGNLVLTVAPPNSSSREVVCYGGGDGGGSVGGTVTVVVTYPDGSQSQASKSIVCEANPF